MEIAGNLNESIIKKMGDYCSLLKKKTIIIYLADLR